MIIGDELADNWWDNYQGPGYMTGQATTLPADHEDDPAERVRRVVEEVTGKPVERKTPPRIGFF